MREELDYLLARASQELAATMRASCPEARRAHHELTDLYLDKAQDKKAPKSSASPAA